MSLAEENLKAYASRVSFSPGDMMQLSVPDDSQTAVGALYSLIHLPANKKDCMFWSGMGVEGTLKVLKEAGFSLESSKVEGDKEETFLWVIAMK
ncbi:uncharacterized protein J7T54_002493 [Emericellopsis cladophorae]|uniref:Uncharacterized protein n=1 Tax=Emericellopsis cladophorae TaxID=2686198 RepID=A0A9P9Y097_9HYPO|nr:uncharacterized protein J7T54_002493 [Emericellopsis cladophorae]KAI6781137.1 hypothetical protein J7T54_002493 [Emericellopsis cladophorae]